jgi:hypothetical protein
MKIRNSLVGALLISGTAFGAVYAAAAEGFVLNGGAVQEASDATLECQTDPINVTSWGVNSSDDAITGGKVTFVQFDGVDAACDGTRLMGRVEDGSGNVVGYTTVIGSSGAAENFPMHVVLDSTDPAHANGFYKLQLIEPDGSHGVDADVIEKLVLWIEGATQAPPA